MDGTGSWQHPAFFWQRPANCHERACDNSPLLSPPSCTGASQASPRHEALRAFLVDQRQRSGLRQVDLAKCLKRGQDYISTFETGQKIVNVIDLVEWAEAIGFGLREAIMRLGKVSRGK
jgi:hypothetical protein